MTRSVYCWCQRAYDTGFTGVARIDRALERHYEFGTLDPSFFRRAYDHYASGRPYKGVPRAPYCFSAKVRGECPPSCRQPERCDHARYRPTNLAAKARFFIERHCPAAVHYPRLLLDDQLGKDAEVALSDAVEYEFAAVNKKTGVPRFPQGVRRHPASDKYVEESESYERLLMARGHHQVVPGVPYPLNCWYEPRRVEYKGDDALDANELARREELRRAADHLLQQTSDAVATPAGAVAFDLDLSRAWRKRRGQRSGPRPRRGFDPRLARLRRERSKREVAEAVERAKLAGKFVVVPELDVEVARRLAGILPPGTIEPKGV